MMLADNKFTKALIAKEGQRPLYKAIDYVINLFVTLYSRNID